MYLRVTRGHLDPAKSDEAARLVPAIIAAIRQRPGCHGVQVGVDRATGKSIAVSTYETQEQAQYSRELLSEALAPLVALGWQGDAPEIYEQMQ
jgi:quinol monooxygenase YgiN